MKGVKFLLTSASSFCKAKVRPAVLISSPTSRSPPTLLDGLCGGKPWCVDGFAARKSDLAGTAGANREFKNAGSFDELIIVE